MKRINTSETVIAQRIQKVSLVYNRGDLNFLFGAKLENYFSQRAALFKIVSYDKVTTSLKQQKIGLFMLLLTVFGQISGSRRSMLLFRLPEKGPKAAKRSWRAALWPCLVYQKYDHLYQRIFFFLSKCKNGFQSVSRIWTSLTWINLLICWFGFRLEPISNTSLAAYKNYFSSLQKWSKETQK